MKTYRISPWLLAACLAGCGADAPPAGAASADAAASRPAYFEQIGLIEATYEGQPVSQPVVVLRQNQPDSATAMLHLSGASSTLEVAGHVADDSRIAVELEFMTERPGPQTTPVAVSVSHGPRGSSQRWTSATSPEPAVVSFTALEVDGDRGRAVGTFKAQLCPARKGNSDTAGGCRPIEGSFDTRFHVGS